MYYIHKYRVTQRYGGSEEGDWWYDSGVPTGFTFGPLNCLEDDAYAQARALNDLEHERAKRDEQYEYTSVLSHFSNHYGYGVSQDATPVAYPERRPYYE